VDISAEKFKTKNVKRDHDGTGDDIKTEKQKMKLAQVIQKLKTEKALSAIHWYFNTPAIKFGIGESGAGIWAITVSKARCEVRARFGKPTHFSPTPELKKGFAKAMAKLSK